MPATFSLRKLPSPLSSSTIKSSAAAMSSLRTTPSLIALRLGLTLLAIVLALLEMAELMFEASALIASVKLTPAWLIAPVILPVSFAITYLVR